MPHDDRSPWTSDLLWTNAISDSLIGIACGSILLMLVYVSLRRRDVAASSVLLAFGAVVVAFGASQSVSVLTDWNVSAWMAALIKAFSAAASVVSAVLLSSVVPRGLMVPSRGHLADLADRLTRQVQQHRQAEAQLRSSVSRFQNLLEHAPIGMAIVSLDGRFVQVNRALCALVGYGKEELEALTFQQITYPDDLETDLAEAERLIRGILDSYQMNKRYIRKDGQIVWAQLTASVFRDDAGSPLHFIGQVEDISARVAAEQAMRASEARFRALTELSSDWYWEQDEHLRFSYFSESAYASAHGIAERCIGKTRWELPHLRAPEGGWAVHRATLERREAFRDLVLWRIDGDGSVHTVALSGAPVFDAAGQFRGYRGVARDITEQVRGSDALRQSEARFRALTAVSSDWYWEQDSELRFTLISDNAFRILKIPSSASLRVRRWDNPLIEMPEGGWDNHRRALDRHEPFHDFLIRHRDGEGTIHVIALSGAPIFDEDLAFRGYRGTARDITQRVAAEEALRDSEMRFRTLTELTSDWYWEQDEQLRFTFFSEAAYRPPRTSIVAALGKRRWELPAVKPPVGGWDAHRVSLDRRERFRDLVLWRTMDDGLVHTISISGAPIFDERSRFRGYRGVTRDISEQVRASDALRESELRFRALTAVSSDWYWEQDEQFRFTLISENAYRILKRPIGSLLGLCRWELPSYELVEQEWDDHRRTLAQHRTFRDLIVRHRDGEGSFRTLALNGAPMFDDEGAFRGYRGTTQDITAQVLAEQALRESERRARLATEYAHIGIWEKDHATDLVRWSSNIGAMLGRPTQTTTTPGEFATLVHPDDRDQYVRTRTKWFDGSATFDAETRIVWPDGTVRWMELSGGALERAPNGQPVRSLGIIRDITQRKDAESVLRESEERFRLLAENVRDAFWIYHPTVDRFDYVAPRYEQIWGLSRCAIYANARADRGMVLPEDMEKVELVREQQRRGERTEVEFRIRRADGELRWLLARSAPMINSKGELLICGITEDVTERKLQEQRRMEDALHQRDALVREVHHRVKNTLQGVVGLVRRQAARARETSSALEMAIAQVQSVAIVHGVQAQRGRIGVALFEMLEAMTRLHQGLSGRSVDLLLEPCCNGAAQLAENDATAVALVLNELISNAVKHSTQADAAVMVRAQCGAGRARICVRNHGMLPDGFEQHCARRVGTGLKLVETLRPRDGMRIAFHQQGEMVEVKIEMTAPVLISPTPVS